MEIDISQVLKHKYNSKEFELSSLVDYNDSLISFRAPLNVKCDITLEDEYLSVKGNVQGDITYVCDRCAMDCVLGVDIDFDEQFIKAAELNDYELSYNSNTLNLDDMIIRTILSDMPMTLLCKNDCRGMCQDCYANLNVEECKCSQNND